MKRCHEISSASIIEPDSPTPIISVANYIDSQVTTDSTLIVDDESPHRRVENKRNKNTRRARKSTLLPIPQDIDNSPIISSTALPSSIAPSPEFSQISSPVLRPVSPDPMVALDGCIAVIQVSSTDLPSHPDPIITPLSLPHSPQAIDTMVALNGCTADITANSSDTSSQPNLVNYPISLPHSSPIIESMVALSGCTADNIISQDTPSPPDIMMVPDSVVALTGRTVHDETILIPQPNIAQSDPPPTLCDLPPSTSDDDDPFDIPPPVSPPRPTSQLPFPYTSTLLNPDTPVFHPTSTTHHIEPGNDTSPSRDTPTEAASQFLEKWSSIFSTNSSWHEFSEQCSQFANDVISECEKNFQGRKKAAPRRPFRPSAKPVNNNRRPLAYNPIEARRIQSLYRISKKRAARQVMSDSKPSYSGSVDEANEFFTRVFGDKTVDVDEVKKGLNEFVPSAPADDALGDPVTADEVSKKLRSLSNSAPGADRVEYRHLKSVDSKGQILSLIYNRCLLENDVPIEWKSSRTVLIHKKGDAADVSNFRPIALMSCIYKLLMSVVANRLVNYSINNNLLSSSQKSARPTEGCYEHTYILQSLVLDAKRHQKNLSLAWLDLRNAFGSVPHTVIAITLSHLGVPDSIVNLVRNVYTNATTQINTPAGSTPNIPILAGVKQGCPLSPILFNLCIEIIIRAIALKGHKIGPTKHFDAEISVLAYADDLVLIAKSKEKLQQLLDAASSSADLISLHFRPDKCASLSMTYDKKYANNIALHDFKVQGNVMPALKEHEHYRYLGVPIGMIRDITSLDSLVDDLCGDLERIRSSHLAPWQKLDAIKTFVQPCLTFSLRAGEPEKQSLSKYKKKLVEVVRSICNLPTRATPFIIFASSKVGGLGFQDPMAEVDIQCVVQALKMLSSNDPVVSAVARGELLRAVRFAAQADPSPALVRDFMSGSTEGKLHPNRIRYRTHSLWTRARSACRRLHITFNVPNNGAPFISTENKGPCLAKSSSHFLHQLVQDRASQKLMALPDQGKVARAFIKDAFSNGSSWLFSGLNMRFKDWRFIHRARLNVVPTNQNKSRWSECSNLCRVCNSHPETLPHVICHCPSNMVKIRDRHNVIVHRLAKAVRYGSVRIDQQIPGLNDQCRPDVVIEEDHQITIIDVTCPFENDHDALAKADYNKVMKYDHVKHHFHQLGITCNVYAFVIGSLGGWHPNNEAVLNLRMSKTYKSLFRKLCYSDVICGSADIYYNHMDNS